MRSRMALMRYSGFKFSAYDAGKGVPLSEVIEDIKAEAYRKGWHDAIRKALDETHNYYTEDGVFRAIQEESLIGVGMIMDKHISGKENE